ncbi:MAG: hypothetical protein U0230_15750 [Polyangiales bacterium]
MTSDVTKPENEAGAEAKSSFESRLSRILFAGAPVWMVLVALAVLFVRGKLEVDPYPNGCDPDEAPSFAFFLALGPVSFLVPVCGEPQLPMGEALYCPAAILMMMSLIAWLSVARLEGSRLLWALAMAWWMILGVFSVVLHGFE